MSLHRLQATNTLPLSLAEAWDFFSSPGNVLKLTPPHMDMRVVTGYTEGDKIYPGMLIKYRLKPLWGLPSTWVTEITEVQERVYFIDIQKRGPYAFWQHTHRFKEVPGGTEVSDLMEYRAPLGFIGDIVNTLIIKKQLDNLLEFRREKLRELFLPSRV